VGVNQTLRGARVLVAEDEPILALDLALLLSESGAEVAGPAESVKQALELTEKQYLTCAILDVSLDDGLVFPAAHALKKKGVQIIFYTGQADLEGIKRDWPGAEVLMKPISGQALLQAVVSACARCSVGSDCH
jgi:DNA-binding response OmpR family regulator